MVRQMGGDITVKSEFGKGTTFYISLKVETKILKQDLIKFQKKNHKNIVELNQNILAKILTFCSKILVFSKINSISIFLIV